jgi:hypothetical protein
MESKLMRSLLDTIRAAAEPYGLNLVAVTLSRTASTAAMRAALA